MVELNSNDVFLVMKHAQEAGLLALLPPVEGEQGPGKRFFESVQKDLLESVDLEALDQVLFCLAPTIRYMADEEHWEPAEFSSDDLFWAFLHLQKMGVFQVVKLTVDIPGEGDRFFEHVQRILLDRIGVENMERLLTVLGQCICFLASEEAMVNVTESSVAVCECGGAV